MGGLARRRLVSPPLWIVAARRSAVGKAVAARRRPEPCVSGARVVIGLLEALTRPLLRMLDAEDAHRLAIHALKLPPFVKLVADDPRLAVRAFGLNFPNPGGMAAGFGKHAEGPPRLVQLRFGFLQVRTRTAFP